MVLKNARLARAESFTPEKRIEYDLPDSGLVVIESRNPILRRAHIPMTSVREYLLTLGPLGNVDIAEE